MLLSFGWNELDALGSLLGGVFGAAAFAVALAVLVREMGKHRADLEARRDERHDEERRQARLVYATLDGDQPTEPVSELKDEPFEPRSEVHVKVFNHSDAPVWDIEVEVPGREGRPLLIEQVPPHGVEGNGWLDAPRDWYITHVSAGCPGTPYWTPLDVTFVDNAGRRWRRSGRAEPVRLLDSEDRRSSRP
ncbi:hypothetical protein AB0C12_12440 [Actinoplanes sp. NPDC048967]|uniref:hypothetical protein n=1 Tax=Actinoplanes sp. NPDC048967 TaxID=3155269 RepID=UPI0033FA0CAD